MGDFEIQCTQDFSNWLYNEALSLTFTTYHTGKLFTIGLKPEGDLSIFERSFPRCSALWCTDQHIYLSSEYQIWRLENILPSTQLFQDLYDRCYVPHVSYVTGCLDVHDMAIDSVGRIIFINTLFSCLAMVSESESFDFLWKPPFVDELEPEDRCHLNGFAMVMGRPKYVTMASMTNIPASWKEFRLTGGVVMDTETNEAVLQGLCLPSSPRFYDNKLWLLDSGTGYFGFMQEKDEKFSFIPLTLCPGFARGLVFHKHYAIIGVSELLKKPGYIELPVCKNIAAAGLEPMCGFIVVDLRDGEVLHRISLTGVINEIFSMGILPQVRMPILFGIKNDDMGHLIRFGEKFYQSEQLARRS